MIITLEITRDLSGQHADTASVDFCTVSNQITGIFVEDEDYCHTQHEQVVLRMLGGRVAIIKACKELAAKARETDDIDAFKSVRDQSEGA